MKPLLFCPPFRASLGILALALWCQPLWAQFPGTKPANRDDVTTIFLPAPRPLRQALGRAQTAITEQRFADAVEELGAILNGETADDFFLSTAAQGDAQTSLKTQALEMLGSMPEKGRRLYELNYGADARNMLDAALADGNIARLTEVARRYFHTKAGYEAAILLGRLNLDQGRPLAAALAFKRVADVPSAASQYDPELSILLATSWQFAGQSDKARETLASLKQRMPGAKIASGPMPVVLFEKNEDALSWLTKLVGAGGKSRHSTALEWVMFRGNETRTASTSASLPLLSPRWTVPGVDDPQDAQRIRQAAKNPADKVIVPALQPLVVKDYVVYRTVDRVIGASLANQGKRVWYFPWDESPYEKAARTTNSQPRTPASATREQQLNIRIWEDHPFGEMSSDGQQVFLIDEIGFPAIWSQMPQVFMGGRGARMFPNPFIQQTFNKLVAIDLNREGALSWKVGGESGEDDPNLAGAFFLGPPLPMAGQLFVLAEFNSEIRLLCLSAKTGALEWKQSLAMMPEGRAITMDSLRRLAGATPSFAEGVLVCPTSGEGVAAVDLATRTLRWGYQYPRWDAPYFTRNNGFGGGQIRGDTANQPKWIDGSITIAGGVVLLTPVESTDLHCLDLLTGKAKWKPQPRDEMLFVGCVHDGKAILVGKKQVKAIKLADGEAAWAAPVDLEADMPSGRGYQSEHYYYLPTTSSQLLKIDLDTGKIAAQMKTASVLGNLVCYKDELISQSSEGISSFYLAEPLRKRVEELLAKNPNDSWALARKGEVLLQDGKQEEALDLLRRAMQLAPADGDTKTMLARAMISLLRSDFAVHKNLAVEAEPLLADQPSLKREFYRLRAQAMETAGSPLEAFVAYVALRDQPSDAGVELEELSRDHSVRRERWISARLATLYAKADAGAKAKIDEEVAARLAKTKESSGSASLADFVDLFGFHPLATAARIELGQRLAEGGKLLEAELAVGELATHSDPKVAGPATAILASLYEKAQRFDLAQDRYAELAGRYSAVVCLRDQTGKDLADEAAKRPDIQKQLASRTWPSGAVEAKVADPQGNNRGFGGIPYLVAMSEFRGASPRGQRALLLQAETAVRVFDSAGKAICATSLIRQGQQNLMAFQGVGGAAGKMHGHLMFISGSGEVLALDTLRIRQGLGNEALLWRADTAEPDVNRRSSMMYSPRQFNNPLALPRPTDIRGAAAMGPATSQGITFLRGRQLVCVEPLTGKTLWERSGIEPGSDIFGDEQKIVVIAPQDKSDQALVYSAIDGTFLDRRMVDRQDHRWATCGRNVLAWESNPGMGPVKLRLYDATNQGTGLWSKEVNQPTKGFILEGEELALLEPTGKFTIISLRTGKELLSATVLPEPELQSIVVLASQQQYFLIANQPQSDAGSSVQAFALNGAPGGTSVHGRVYAFDRATGAAQWQTPAFVSQHALPQDQPTESPVLVFARRKSTTRGGGAASNVCSLLCLDRRDGSIVYEEDSFLGQASFCDVVSDRDSRSVSITLSAASEASRTVNLKFTENPAPPRPPAQTGAMSSLTFGPRGTVVDVAGDVFRALNQIPGGGNPGAGAPGVPIVPFGRLRLPGVPPK